MSAKKDSLLASINRILEWRGLFIFNMIILVSLMALVFWVSWRNLDYIKLTVTNDFNQQQLILARQVARDVESSVDDISRSLRFESRIDERSVEDAHVVRSELAAMLSRLGDEGVISIHALLPGPVVFVADSSGVSVRSVEEFRRLGFFSRRSEAARSGVTIFDAGFGRGPAGEVSRMVYIASLVELPRGGESYFLVAVTDISRLVRRVAQPVISGETGYSWVIDEKARFLYHPRKDFVGRNSIGARRDVMPDVSFDEIDRLQSESMITGGEGTSRYVSGSHRNVEGRMQKLIAWAPIRVGNTDWMWSAAVVAPEDEVRSVIRRMFFRQSVLEALLIIGIFITSFMAFAYKRRLSNVLREKLQETERSLHQTEEYYRSIFESAQDPIYLLDENMRFISMNMYTAKILRNVIAARDRGAAGAAFGPGQFTGMKITAVLDDENGEFLETRVKKAFFRKVPETFEHHFRVGDRYYHFNTRYIPIFSGDGGSVSSVLGISRDITEKKEMEHLIYNTEKLASLGTLAAGVAHEINNPLGVILGFTDLMLDRTEEGTRAFEDLKIIEENCLNCKRIVENLMSFARVTEGIEEVVDLNTAIDSVVRIVQSTMRMTGIELRERVQEGLPGVRGDTREIRQVFFNLINNAVFAMRDNGGELLIETVVLPGRVEIHFIDQGAGIAEHIGNRIFDPFFTTKEVGEGTGLGLSVSYGIVQKYGGSIRYTSVARSEAKPDEEIGTRFVVSLPVHDPSQRAG
jgi:two-component system NtrC family sensor kinase